MDESVEFGDHLPMPQLLNQVFRQAVTKFLTACDIPQIEAVYIDGECRQLGMQVDAEHDGVAC